MQLAGVQLDIQLGQVAHNLQTMADRFRETRQHHAELTVFPECAVTGYCFESLAEAREFAESIPGPATEHFTRLCREFGGHVIVGLLEADGDKIYNATALIGPQGVISSYRKVHLPFLGVDQFTTYGDRPFSVQEVGGVRLGMNICYDGGFPEPARCLAILGADLVVLPTNWPTGAQCAAEYAINTRAMENTIYYMAINRVGVERGCTFIGQSRICDPLGRTLALGSFDKEEILYATIDPALARQKHLVRVPGKNEVNRLADRRPEMYGPILWPHTLPRPGRGVVTVP